MKPNRIVLTGPSAAGKSTISKFFAELGYEIIDVDVLAKNTYKNKTSQAFRGIIYALGEDVIGEDGYIDKAKVAELIFTNSRNRKKLNTQLYPEIVKAVYDEIKGKDKFVIDMPIYFDCGAPDFNAKIVLVDAPIATRIKRLEERGHSRERAVAQSVALKFGLNEKMRSDLYINTKWDQEDIKKKLVDWLQKEGD